MRLLALLAVAGLLVSCGDDGGGPPEATTTTVAGHGTAVTTTTAAPPVATTTPTTTTEPEDEIVTVVVTIAAGEVTVTVDGEPLRGRVMVSRGQWIRIDFTTDVHEELHVHGYDHLIEAHPGADASVEFLANIPGIFEVERHFAGHLKIFDIHVE